ncbi:MAG: hypothetical protein O3C60_09570 [Planctomycetota bacterium]|nr:hypothetical protein [Planctomycetota bacterium]
MARCSARGRRNELRQLVVEHLEMRWTPSVTLLSEDFQTTPVQTLPTSVDASLNVTGPEGFALVTGGGVIPEPFGPSGNRSLVIDNPGPAQPAIAWTSEFSNDPTAFTSGTISFDLYLTEPGSRNWTYIDVRLGYGGAARTIPTTVGDTTVWNSFRVNASSPDIVVDNGNGGVGSAPITSLSKLHVVYTLNGVQKTYRLSINNVPIDFGSGNVDRPWMAGAPGVNMVAFVGAFPLTSGPVFIDNVLAQSDTAPPVGWTPPANEPTNTLEWYQHRGNKRLTGEAHVSSNIVQGATTLWSSFIGSRESWFSLSPSNNQSTVIHPANSFGNEATVRRDWNLGGPYLDLSGNGGLTAVTTGPLIRIGDFIPGNGVLEKLEGEVFDTTFGQGVVRLYVYQGGSWVQQWQSPTIPAMFSIPNLITGDFDNDGSLEVALTPWNDMYILSMQTGQIEKTVRFKPTANESGRPYGWFGAFDLDGDQRSEFVLMGDFQDFVTVIGWDNQGNLTKKWEHVFDARLANKQTTHRPGAFPVLDVTGDGALEIVTSVYNETGDGLWHTLVLDALTGVVRADLPNRAVDGRIDIDGNGDWELLVRHTIGSLLSPSSTLEVLDWQGGSPVTRWTHANSEFIQQPIADFPPNINSATSTGKNTVLIGRPSPSSVDTFFTRSITDATRNGSLVNFWQTDPAITARSIATVQGPSLDVLAIRSTATAANSILLASETVGADEDIAGDYNRDGRVDAADFTLWQDQLGTSVSPGSGSDGNRNGVVDTADYDLWNSAFGAISPQKIFLQGQSGGAIFSKTGAPPRSSVVVGRLDGPSSAPTLVVQGGSQSIVALQPRTDATVSTRWLRAGLGAFFGANQNQGQHENTGVALGDVNGDSLLETLYATSNDTGKARLIAARPDGSELWHADFDVPGGQRVFNQPGLVAWRTGHFTATTYEDVLVQLMHGIGGTGEFVLLDGRNGTVRWNRTYGNTPGSSPIQRGAGEAQMAVYDWDRDGLDEAVNFNPDMFYVVDGNGANLIDRSVFNGGVFPGGSPLFGAPIVADFANNQTDTILFAGSYSQFGLVTRQGSPIWNTPFVFDNTPGFIQGIGDVDGDGDLDLLSPGHPIAPATYTQSVFHAYNAANGQLLWTVPLPGRPHAAVGGAFSDTPTLSVSGDIDGDGRVESLFAIGDTLYAVGANASGTSGSIEWTYRPDGGLLGSPIIADANGDGLAEIIVVSTSGRVYGIGNLAQAILANSPAQLGSPSSLLETISPPATTKLTVSPQPARQVPPATLLTRLLTQPRLRRTALLLGGMYDGITAAVRARTATLPPSLSSATVTPTVRPRLTRAFMSRSTAPRTVSSEATTRSPLTSNVLPPRQLDVIPRPRIES